jgi:AAA ATPase domain
LVGRAGEIEQIDRARGAGAGGVVIYGPAGVGKSRLARDAVDRAAQDGAAVHWVQAASGTETIPLGAFAGLVLPEARAGDLLDVMQRSARWLAQEAENRPLVLAVDDAQWLDPTSAALVLHLVRTGTAFVVVTVRTGERAPEAIVALWKDGDAIRLELEPLDEADAEVLVEAILGGPLEAAARRWLAQTSRGNALYARELVLAARAGGALRERSGLWRMPSRPTISASLRELVTARMAGLDSGQQRTLELLAIGEPLRLAETILLADEESLEALEQRGLITIASLASDAPVRLAHPLFGEVIRDALGSLRARAIKLQLARTVGARETLAPDETIRLAQWLLDAGAAARGPDPHRRAGCSERGRSRSRRQARLPRARRWRRPRRGAPTGRRAHRPQPIRRRRGGPGGHRGRPARP